MKVKLFNNQVVDLLIGHDTEFFVTNQAGKAIPASQFLPGTKAVPHKLQTGVCHPDGVSLEIGSPPSDTPTGMLANLFRTLEEVQQFIPNGCTLSDKHEVLICNILNAKQSDLEFGCSYEYDNEKVRTYFEHLESTPYKKVIHRTAAVLARRFSGFHLHLGYTSEQADNTATVRDCGFLVRALDIAFDSLGIPDCNYRSKMYGGRGAFRIKPYGIEYRRLDCRAITTKVGLQKLMAVLECLPDVFDCACGRISEGILTRIVREKYNARKVP